MADEMNGEREALIAYLKDCDDNASVPDVGGAWHAAFQAGRASLSAAEPATPEFSEAQIASVCMSYRHDFGLLGETDRKSMIWTARQWERAFAKEREWATTLTQVAAIAAGAAYVYACARSCENCGHSGINDGHATDAACNTCDWIGPSPKEDRCPGCGREGTMTEACPKCSGGPYRLVAETTIDVADCGWRGRATHGQAPAGAAVPWENFPSYLIDHCEGDTISEEGLQHALAAMLSNPQYAALQHPARQPLPLLRESAERR